MTLAQYDIITYRNNLNKIFTTVRQTYCKRLSLTVFDT